MPRRGTKKSFNKDNSVTFNLVHRSQKDPLAADESASQRVLVPVNNLKEKKKDIKKYKVFFDNKYEYLNRLEDVNILSNELTNLNHLSTHNKNYSIKDKSNIVLPSSVFESNIQEKTGLLNRIPNSLELQLDLDPDVVAALDDDFDFNNEANLLEDNFIELANKEDDSDKCNKNNYSSCLNNFKCMSINENKEVDNLIFDCYTFQDEETKSHFTEYSITSSVIRRNEQLNLLDQKFEKIYADYDEHEIGDLNNDEIEGHMELNSNVILLYAKEYEDQQKHEINNKRILEDKEKVINRKLYSFKETEDATNLEKFIIEKQEQKKWDCESILTTYSNLYNNPKIIYERKNPVKIKLHEKNGIPKNVLNKKGYNELTIHNLVKCKQNFGHKKLAKEEELFVQKNPINQLNQIKSAVNVLNLNSKMENIEEKKIRKMYIKSQKRERRCERKATLKMFKTEKQRQEKILLNAMHKLQENRIF